MTFTIPDAADWPDNLERERSLTWAPNFGNERGPPGLDGTSQFRNMNGGGLWLCAFNGVQLRKREHVLAWRTMELRLRGGMTPVNVPACTYRPSPATGSTIQIKAVDGGWAARALSGRVQLVYSTEIEPGMFFSDYDATYGWRLYGIESVELPGSPGTSDQRDITFWPPARVAVANNHFLNFDNPRCVMRLASSDSMDMDLELRKRGNPNAEFIEAY